MKIIIIHNKYKEKGGEDFVSNSEYQLLKEKGHRIKLLTYDNSSITSFGSLAKLAYRSFYNTKVAKDLRELIDSFEPDIIHVHNFFYIVSPSIFYVAKSKNIPIVMTLHNYRLICVGALLLRDNKVCELCVQKKLPVSGIIHKCHRNSYLQSMQLTLMTGLHKYLGTWRNKVDKFIVLTEFARQKVLSSSLNLRDSQVEVKANSSADEGYTAGRYKRENYFLFIGRLSEEKGVKVLLESLDLYKYHVKIIGDGPLRDLVLAYTAKYDNIEYLGFQNKEVIIRELKNCNALIFPSTWYECMPLTILESFSLGTPIICSDMDNLNEIVINNYNGVLFVPGDPTSLVQKVKFMEGSGSQTSNLYVNARECYEKLYTPADNYRNLINIYRTLIKPKVELAEIGESISQ